MHPSLERREKNNNNCLAPTERRGYMRENAALLPLSGMKHTPAGIPVIQGKSPASLMEPSWTGSVFLQPG